MILTHGSNSAGSGGSLPEGYESIDYLEIPNTFSTGVIIPFNSGSLINFNNNSLIKFRFIFDYIAASDVGFIATITNSSNSTRYINTTSTQYDTLAWEDTLIGPYPGIKLSDFVNTEVTVELSLNKFKWNDNEFSVNNPGDTLKNICVGSLPLSNRAERINLKNIFVEYDGDLVCACYPAMRTNDSVRGMIDVINKDFFTISNS